MTKHLSIERTGLLMALLSIIGIFDACRKPALKESGKQLQTMSGQVPVTFNVEDIYARLPQTVMHNLSDQVHLQLSEAQWRYEQEYVMVRIPLNNATNRSYIYAVKPNNAPLGPTRAFLVQFQPDAGSTTADFSGKQIWLNLQDWTWYGVQYVHNQATAFMEPLPLYPHWESVMLDAGLFYVDGTNKIAVYDEPRNPNPVYVPWDGDNEPDKMFGHGKGSRFFKNLFDGIGNLITGIGGIFDGDGGGGGGAPGWNQGGGGGMYGGGDGSFDPPGWEGPIGGSGYENPPPPPINIWDNTMASNNNWSELGEYPTEPVPIYVNETVLNAAVAEGLSVYSVTNPTVSFLQGMLGLNQNQVNWLGQNLDKANSIRQFLIIYVPGLTDLEKKGAARDHLKMMMENQDYVTRINNLPSNWWDQDQNGFMEAKKIHMEIYLQSNMFGLIDCNEVNQSPLGMYQTVGSYQPPAAVTTRIADIISQNAPAYSPSNFKLMTLSNAFGPVVNCDYFYVKINSLPYVNNIQLSADQFLEYFRTHLNDFIGPNINVNFQPYTHYVAGSVNINETSKWNSSYENSLGAVVHIDMAYDGTIIESGYSRNAITDHHSFTFSTMYSPIDGDHPVSGNRRFGIFKQNGSYYFYICGVDRTNDFITTVVNFGDVAFNGADDLWHSVQAGMLDFFDTHQGDAVYAEEKIARPLWWGPVADFLKGKKNIQQFKDALNCP